MRSDHANGPGKRKQINFDESWCSVVYELYNITSVEDFQKLFRAASGGRLSRDEFVTKVSEVESRAGEKTRAFYIRVFLPWAIENHVATDPTVWRVAPWFRSERQVQQAAADDSSYRRYNESHFQMFVLQSLVDKGEADKAIKLASAMLGRSESQEETAAIFTAAGVAYLQEAQWEAGIADLTEAIRLGLNEAWMYRDRAGPLPSRRVGRSHRRLHRGDSTRSERSRTILVSRIYVRPETRVGPEPCRLFDAIRLCPSNSDFYLDRCQIYLEKDDYDGSLRDIKTALQINPNNANAYQCRAQIYQRKGEKTKAEQDFAQAKRLGSAVK